MRIIQKIGVYFLMLVLAAIVAGIYGVLHDQISYAFSNEYFTQFKFKQFGISWAYESPRLGATYVGAFATWWMGVLVFLILGLFGFMFNTPRLMTANLSIAFVVVMATALFTGLLGLMYGYYQINEATIATNMQWAGAGVADPIQFVRVGYMHNASYLGGITGLIAGIAYLVLKKLSYNKSFQRTANAAAK